jgi:tRNA A-37 threonylcarbamoyl transferase component Bud32
MQFSFQTMRKKKVYFGWLHARKMGVKPKQVRGTMGNRVLEFEDSEQLSPTYLLERGKKLFFPNGNSKKGHVNDMSFHLSLASGDKIEEFLDVDGESTTFDRYLTSHGLYPSRCILYVISTGQKSQGSSIAFDEQSATKTPLCVLYKGDVQKDMDIDVKYSFPSASSKYSESFGETILTSREACHSYMSLTDPDIRDSDVHCFEPQDNGCVIHYLEKGSEAFIVNKNVVNKANVESGILQGPNKIFGFENEVLVLGCLAVGKTGLVYNWYRNGKVLASSNNLVYVDKAGAYFCVVKDGDIEHISETIEVCKSGHAQAKSNTSKKKNTSLDSNEQTNSENTAKETTATMAIDSINDIGSDSSQPQNSEVQNGCKRQKLGDEQLAKELSKTENAEFLEISELKYCPKELLGKGSFASVYKGEYNGTTVAVKKLRMKREQTVRKIVSQELLIHRSLLHPHIVTFLGAAIHKGYLLLVTEYIEGANLEDVIFDEKKKEQLPRLNDDNKKSISIQVTQAVAYLHNKTPTIIHCDVKPANVLLTKSYDIAKLCDLGISKVRSYEQTLTTASKDVLPGTPSYIAPEILIMRKRTTKASDIWSLGCTLLELHTEEECWATYEVHRGSSEDSDDESITALKEHMRAKLSPYGPGLTSLNRIIAGIIRKCLDYNAKDRPSARHIIEYLKQLK